MVNSGRLILILNIPNGKLDWQHLISFLDILSKVLLMYEENYNINSNLIDATFSWIKWTLEFQNFDYRRKYQT